MGPLKRNLHAGNVLQNALALGIAKLRSHPLGSIEANPFHAFDQLRQGDERRDAVVKGVGRGQHRLVMGNAIAKQLNRFEAVVDDASCDSRIGKGFMKAAALSCFVVRIHPQCPVVRTLDKVYPKPESEFGKHLSRLSAKAVFNSRLIERVAPVR